ncbi:MAG: glutathione S-transferase family protein [Rhizobiales bacterium]|nr:glutathione S-transferase family protein [Hyphomicrobiales bacterium]
MKLYGFPPSPNTWKVRAVIAHLGIPVDFELVDLAAGQQRTPEYLALNPTGRAPVLVDGDLVLWESNAIMQYLAGCNASPLWPDDARIRADIMRWQSWQLAHWGTEACGPLIFQRAVKRVLNIGAPDAAIVARATDCFNREASVLDAHLSKQTYLVGDRLTLADFSVAVPLFLAEPAELPLAPYQHVRDWFARVSALPAWRETAPAPAAAAA